MKLITKLISSIMLNLGLKFSHRLELRRSFDDAFSRVKSSHLGLIVKKSFVFCSTVCQLSKSSTLARFKLSAQYYRKKSHLAPHLLSYGVRGTKMGERENRGSLSHRDCRGLGNLEGAMGTTKKWNVRRNRALHQLVLLLLVTVSAGATNCIGVTNSNKKKSTTTTNTTPSVGDTSGVKILSAATQNPDKPGTEAALIGTSEFPLSQFCGPSSENASAGATGAFFGTSTCQCVFQYSLGGETFTEAVDTTYVEENMVTCPITSLPVGATQIRVALQGIAVTSEFVDYNSNGTGSGLDSTDSASFVEVSRNQAIQHICVPYLFDSTFCDPYQSRTNRNRRVFDFYSTNPGGSLLTILAQSSDAQMNHYDFSLSYNSIQSWQNLNIYSVTPDSNGSYLIYPPAGSAFDRFNFSLAKEAVGVFTVPLHSHIAPGVFSRNSTLGPLGYAAKVSIQQDGSVTCPSDSSIPSDYEWVLVWLERGSKPPIKYVSDFGDNPKGAWCNVGRWGGSNPATVLANRNSAVFRDCEKPSTPLSDTNFENRNSLSAAETAGTLAARIFGQPQVCLAYDEDIQGLAGGRGNTLKAGQGNNTIYPNGTDQWTRVGSWNQATNAIGSNLNLQNPNPEFDSNNANILDSGDQSPAYSIDLKLSNLTAGGNSDSNFIFVVTPVGTNINVMTDELPGSGPYLGVTFHRKEDCTALNPDADATCISNSAKKTRYSTYLVDQDQSPSDTSQKKYPVCAVREK